MKNLEELKSKIYGKIGEKLDERLSCSDLRELACAITELDKEKYQSALLKLANTGFGGSNNTKDTE